MATVNAGGQTMTTKDGFGITHFSDVYASPIGPTIKNINKGDKPGTSVLDGAVKTSVNLPSYKSLGQDIPL